MSKIKWCIISININVVIFYYEEDKKISMSLLGYRDEIVIKILF